MEENIIWGLVLATESLITICASVKYYQLRKLFKSFNIALSCGINNISSNEVQNSKLCIVSGQVKSIGPPIRSLSQPNITGVMQSLIIKEHMSEMRNGIWCPSNNIIDAQCNIVPFELKSDNFRINITSPRSAKYIKYNIVEDRFEPSVSNFLGLLFGYHRKGYQYIEGILKEDIVLTGFGEVIVDNNKNFQLIPPRDGTDYILTTMDAQTLLEEIKSEKKITGVVCAIFGTLTCIMIGKLFYDLWKEWKRRRIQNITVEQIEAIRAIRNTNLNEESFTCIVCFTNPREIISLPCGHVALCYDCSQRIIDERCTICRRNITQSNVVIIS